MIKGSLPTESVKFLPTYVPYTSHGTTGPLGNQTVDVATENARWCVPLLNALLDSKPPTQRERLMFDSIQNATIYSDFSTKTLVEVLEIARTFIYLTKFQQLFHTYINFKYILMLLETINYMILNILLLQLHLFLASSLRTNLETGLTDLKLSRGFISIFVVSGKKIQSALSVDVFTN